ncbi:DUF1600 domain-containing protein [Ureaplasma diversum]|uniref:DUF1600 domain-containing protein n=1 Tax=Ureaplasma diversum TaxID=42094 RepID=UPI000A5C0DC8|nr:DUF1600 domain-containing protein [Ureaplasma diversum]
MKVKKRYINRSFNEQVNRYWNNQLMQIVPKLLNQIIITNAFLLIFIICLSVLLAHDQQFLKYPIDYTISNYSYLPQQQAGAVGLYSIIWYCFVNVLFFLNISKNKHFTKKEFVSLVFASILFNPFAYYQLIKHIKSKAFYWSKTFYWILSDNNKIEFNIKNKLSIAALIAFIIFLPFCCLFLLDYWPVDLNNIKPDYSDINLKTKIYYGSNSWIGNLHYFTVQSNWMAIVVLLIYLINPKARIVKNNTYLITILVYILIVGVIWTGVLYPFNSRSPSWSWFNSLTGFYHHIVTPITFLVFALYVLFNNKVATTIKYKHIICCTTFYFSIYLLYAIFLPIVANVSVYSLMTNVWPFLNGDPIMLLVFIGVFLLMIATTSAFWAINNKIVKKFNKQLIHNPIIKETN